MRNNGNYVVVYVLGTKVNIDKYRNNEPVSVKIGQTKKVDFRKKKEDIALERIKDFSTGLFESVMLFDSFLFEGTGKIDDNIRKKLKELNFNGVSFSSDCDRKQCEDNVVTPGKELVCGVSKEQIHQAVKLYLYDVMSATILSDDEDQKDRMESLKDIIRENFKHEDEEDSEEEDSVAFWDRVKQKLNRADTCGKDKQYVRINSVHAGCYYIMTRRKSDNSLVVSFCSEARRDSNKKDWYYSKCKGDEELRNLISSKMECIPPKENLFNDGPVQSNRRNDKWSWSFTKSSFENDEKDATWLANKLKEMYDYFESLEF